MLTCAPPGDRPPALGVGESVVVRLVLRVVDRVLERGGDVAPSVRLHADERREPLALFVRVSVL